MAARVAARMHDRSERSSFPERFGAGRDHGIGVPRLSAQLIRRDGLIARLDALPAPALTVLQAGTGFGKTTLLTEWAHGRPAGEPLVWVTADDSVRDAVGFWLEVLHAIQHAGLLPARELDRVEAGDGSLEILAASLHHLFASLVAPITLVIDSFDRFGDAGVERMLVDILRRTDRLRVVVATQGASELASASTASRIDTLVLEATALRFSDEEVLQLAARLGVTASQDELHELTANLEGWPYGIRAVMERHRRQKSTAAGSQHSAIGMPTRSSLAVDAGHVSAHLLDSLRELEGLDLLVATSILESFTLEQAAVLGSPLDEHTVLEQLQSQGMGSWQLDIDPPEYRLHPALRRALRGQLDKDRTRAIADRLARWHFSRAEPAPAFEAAIHARDWALAERCVRSDLSAVLVHLRLHPDLIVGIPRSVLRREPALMLVTGIVHHSVGHHSKAIRMLLAAVAAFDMHRSPGRGPLHPDQVWVQGAQTIALRLVGRYEQLPAALRRYSQMADSVDDPEGRLDAARLLFRIQSVIALSFMDDLESAEHLALDTGRERHPMSPFQQANVQGLIAFAHARRGDHTRAAAMLRNLAPPGQTTTFDSTFLAVRANIASAWASLERFDVESAHEALQRTAAHLPTTEYWPFILEVAVRIEWRLHGPETALLTLRERRAEKRFKAPLSEAIVLLLVALEAELLLALGRGSEAMSLLTPERLHASARLEVPRSRSLLLAGSWDQAARIADGSALDESQPWNNRIDLLLISASANLRAGDRDTAQRRFNRAASTAERTGVRLPFASMPRDDLLELGRRHATLLAQIPEQPSPYPDPEVVVALSRREHHVLAELASDRTLPEISQTLSVSTNTLKSQLRSVYRKLGVGSRQEAVAVARRTGLLMMSRGHRPDARPRR